MRNSRVAAAVCIFLVVFGNCVTAKAFKLPDTGQGKCYQGVSPYAVMPCAGTGQDGAYTVNPMSFTKNGDGTVTDNNTGLMWLQSNVGTTYNWYQASGTIHPTYNPVPGSLNVCAGLSTGGHSDWRLPSEKELMSIVNYGLWGPAFDINIFYMVASQYWSSAPHAGLGWQDYAWVVDFGGGIVGSYVKSGLWHVQCVRGSQLSFADFQNNGNNTITDNSTGLMWQSGDDGVTHTWLSALSHCQGLPLAGYSDWRLPNIRELESITDATRYSPAIDTVFFPDVQASHMSYYWSSTTEVYDTDSAWCVTFFDGSLDTVSKENLNYVRCVRGAQAGSLVGLTVSIAGSGVGWILSWPAGIECDSDCIDCPSCSALFPLGSTVVLSAMPEFDGSIFVGWSGGDDCIDGVVTSAPGTSCTSIFDKCQGEPVRVADTGYTSYYIYDAYDQTSGVQPFTIEITASNHDEPYLTLDQEKIVILKGGNNCSFVPLPYSFTTVTGSLTVANGTVTLDRILIF